MRKLFALLLAVLLIAPVTAIAADDITTVEDLRKQIEELNSQLDDISGRVDKTERKTALDRINFYGDLRVKGDTLHYKDVTFAPGLLVDFDDFGAKAVGGVFGDPANPASPLGKMLAANPDLAAAFMAGQLQGVGPMPLAPKKTSDINNDLLYTTRLRLGMKAKVWENVDFAGRLTMYKNWGDSTGVKVFDSWSSFTMDGTDSGNTTGDWLRVERAYFDWKDIGGSPFYLSIGRRPSTYGPPSQFRENEMRGGTPSGHLVNFNFDGITFGYKLSEHTGVEGQAVRFCYGQGFESEHGNGELFNELNTKDTHLGGFNVDVINNGTHFVQLTLFRAQDVNDGFKGLIAFPTQYAAFFAPTLFQDLQKFPNFNFVTRVQPSTSIGDMNLGGIGYVFEGDSGFNFFASGGWTQMDPNGKAGMFGGMGSDAVFEAQLNADGSEIILVPARAENSEKHDGFSLYTGVQVPAPLGKFGVEYNYGSRYWMPFTQAQDDVVGSKLATRGHVGEAYYIFDINPNMFIKVGGIYYDYQYSNSGTPVGKPQKIKDIQNGTAFSMLPVVDEAWDGYASLTVKF
jgi:hypothetical protein